MTKQQNEKPLISIIIPVYNSEQYLSKCLDSVINQTIGNDKLDIVVINDGSPDNSMQILEKYRAKYHNITILSQENMGQSVARNTALPHTRGEYIAYVDPDDFLPHDAYENLYNESENGSIDIVAGRFTYVYDDSNNNFTRLGDIFTDNEDVVVIDDKSDSRFYELIRHAQPWYKIVKRSLIVDNHLKFPSNLLVEDIPFTTSLYLLANKIKVIRNVVYNWYIHPNSSLNSAKNKKRSYLEIFKTIETTYEYLEKHGLNEYKSIFDYTVLSTHFITNNRISDYISKECINKYELTNSEYSLVEEKISKILSGISAETILRIRECESINDFYRTFITDKGGAVIVSKLENNSKLGLFAYVFLTLVFIAIAVNLVQFRSIDRGINPTHRAVYNFSTPTMMDIAYTLAPSHIYFLYDLSLALGEVSDNANLILPPHYMFVAYFIEEVLYFGNLSGIERLDYDYMGFLGGFDPTPYIVRSNDDEPHIRQYRIAVRGDTDRATEFIMIEWYDSITFLVDTSLLPAYRLEELRGQR